MHLHVLDEQVARAKRLAADGAAERHGARVSADVLAHVDLVGEAAPADGTVVRVDAAVQALVDAQVVAPAERLAAHATRDARAGAGVAATAGSVTATSGVNATTGATAVPGTASAGVADTFLKVTKHNRWCRSNGVRRGRDTPSVYPAFFALLLLILLEHTGKRPRYSSVSPAQCYPRSSQLPSSFDALVSIRILKTTATQSHKQST